jgi:hypothetical protein
VTKIFCCYRREDSKYQTGRICDHLAARFGIDELFRDVDSIPLGLDFRDVLSEKVARCDVLLAIMGDGWLNAKEATGERRLDNLDDFVRIEIESALRRKIPVIPVLVGRAPIPKAEELPESLRQLAFRNGLAVREDPDFRHDVERLIHGINDVLKATASKDSKRRRLPDLENTHSFLLKNVLKPGGNVGLHRDKNRPEGTTGNPNVVTAPPAANAPTSPVGPASSFSPSGGRGIGKLRILAWTTSILAVGAFLAWQGTRSRSGVVSESLRGNVLRQVESVWQYKPGPVQAQPELEFVDELPPVDYSAFKIIKDERVFDLRDWKPVPPELATKQVSRTRMERTVQLIKTQPADEIRFEFRSTGSELFVECKSPYPSPRVIGQRKHVVFDEGGKPGTLRQLSIDVHAIPVGERFVVDMAATFWNGFQTENEFYVRATAYPNSALVSLLVVFPKDKPYKDNPELRVKSISNKKFEEFSRDKVLLESENRDWLYWEVDQPQADHVYYMHWKW